MPSDAGLTSVSATRLIAGRVGTKGPLYHWFSRTMPITLLQWNEFDRNLIHLTTASDSRENRLHYNEQEFSKPSVDYKYPEPSNLMAVVESNAYCPFFLRFFFSNFLINFVK